MKPSFKRLMTVTKPKALLLSGLCILLSVSTGYAQSQLPSPQLLLNGWQQYVQNVNNALSSYRMRVFVTPNMPLKNATPSPLYQEQIETVVSGNKFHVLFTDNSPNHKDEQEYAYDGKGFDTAENQFFSHQFHCAHHTSDESVENYLAPIRAEGLPIFLNDLLLYPNFDAKMIQSGPSLVTYYLTRSTSLSVVGTDRIGGWNCFHVRFLGQQPPALVIPQDLWFAPIGHYFFPVRIQTTNGDSQVVVIFTRGQQTAGIWVPTEYRVETHLKTTHPSGKVDFEAYMVPSPVFHLDLSDINTQFPDSTFHLACKQSHVPGKHITKRQVLLVSIFIILPLLIVTLIIATLLLRNRAHQGKPNS
ncbi:hypothetical protein CWRG_01045 [Chthonomonas calidirosea]|uniref:hypothetical protein n=1 Tax=Chthonomonas calidirosea TaxID=454171 RepID=UPI0006DD4F4C|nr:hypothetical protein [Chthonomonas calidirosea]CEK15097.1 hypothetical protein CWRG_01045 [Chthonomonas calidirosea]